MTCLRRCTAITSAFKMELHLHLEGSVFLPRPSTFRAGCGVALPH